MKQITLARLQQMKRDGDKIAMLTAYDASFAHILSTNGVDILLVGDSLGNVVHGFSHTPAVTMDMMLYHIRCVAQGNQGAFIMADMPFMTYTNCQQAIDNAARLIRAGAMMVKMEAGPWLEDTIARMAKIGIGVCAHIGLSAQTVHADGGYRVHGKDQKEAQHIMALAKQLADAGAKMLLLECVPPALAADITGMVNIPVIGIGAGPDCDAQVLVTYDVLGLTPGKPYKFAKNFLLGQSDGVAGAIRDYVSAVKTQSYPASEHCYC